MEGGAHEQGARGRAGRRSGSPAWLAVGVAVGIVLAPAAAVAAGVGVTQLAGPSGVRADVARTGQVTTAPSDPGLYRAFDLNDILGSSQSCDRAYTVPHGFSFVLTDLELDTWADTSPGDQNYVAVDVTVAGAPCKLTVVDFNPGTVGVTSVPIQPGFVVPQGHSITASSRGGVDAELYGQGYLVPFADAPRETPLATARTAVGLDRPRQSP